MLSVRAEPEFMRALRRYVAYERERQNDQRISQAVVLISLALHASAELRRFYREEKARSRKTN
jgi:hypothetical protein